MNQWQELCNTSNLHVCIHYTLRCLCLDVEPLTICPLGFMSGKHIVS